MFGKFLFWAVLDGRKWVVHWPPEGRYTEVVVCYPSSYSVSLVRPHFFASLLWVKESSRPRIPDLACIGFLVYFSDYATAYHWWDLIISPASPRSQIPADLGFQISNVYVSLVLIMLKCVIGGTSFFHQPPLGQKFQSTSDSRSQMYIFPFIFDYAIACHWRDLIFSPASLRSKFPADLRFQISNVRLFFYFLLR